jgi:hypothetical protein
MLLLLGFLDFLLFFLLLWLCLTLGCWLFFNDLLKIEISQRLESITGMEEKKKI